MNGLLKIQIKDSCKLALPEGLKELMSDITREVLRAQPQELYSFISDYLSVLLVTREHLTIATQLCDSLCTGACHRELEDELRYVGFDDEDANKIKETIITYFENGGTSEGNLMMKLLTNTKMQESQIEAVKKSIKNAYKRYLVNNTVQYESSSDSDIDEVARAAKHTLQLYRKTKISKDEYQQANVKVQASYKAFGVKRYECLKTEEDEAQIKTTTDKVIRFSTSDKTQKIETSTFNPKHLPSVSSSTLAGSYMNLPKHVPYSVHNSAALDNLEESTVKEHHFNDYIKEYEVDRDNRKNFFQNIPQGVLDHVASDATVEELTDIDMENDLSGESFEEC